MRRLLVLAMLALSALASAQESAPYSREALAKTLAATQEQTPDTPQPPLPPLLENIVVTPSRFDVYSTAAGQRQTFNRDQVRTIPHLGDDLFRALAYVPGAASSDLSARLNIRGGDEDEQIVLVDGAEIYDPFHLRDFFRAFSTIDAEAVGSVEMLTGGFPAEYGGRMSGVIDISTLTPSDQRTDLGASILTMRALSRGATRSGGSWLVSARRGYLHELVRLVTGRRDIDPVYHDLIAKYEWVAGRSMASAHLLASNDQLRLDDTLDATLRAHYNDAYGWLTVKTPWRERGFTENVITAGHTSRDRRGSYGSHPNDSESGSVADDRKMTFATVKSDTTWDLSQRNMLKTGAIVRRFEADFAYTGNAIVRRSFRNLNGPAFTIARTAKRASSSTSFGAYAADRFRVGSRAVGEAGVRAEGESGAPDGLHLSPRLNLAWQATPRSFVRLAWGKYVQPETVYDLQVEDGLTSQARAQIAEHRIAALDYQLPAAFTLRLELYDKLISTPRVRFENLYDRFVVFPELQSDRVRIAPSRSRARGAEVLLRKESGRTSGWISYTHSTAWDEIDGLRAPRTWDQPNAITASSGYRATRRLTLNLSGTWHSGRPTTPLLAQFVDRRWVTQLGSLNSERLPSYTRVDFRASRDFPTTRGGFSFFVEVFNVFNTANVSRVKSFRLPASGAGVATPVYESVAGVIPSFGVTWEF